MAKVNRKNKKDDTMKENHKTTAQRYPENAKRSPRVSPGSIKSMDDVMKVWSQDTPGSTTFTHGANKDVYGSMIPFLFSLFGDLIINPSTVSPSTYKRMVDTDNVIQVSLKYIIDYILNLIKDYTHPNPEFQKFIRRCIAKNKRGFKTMCRDILTSIVYGHSESEIEWTWDEELQCDIISNTFPLPQMTTVMRVNIEGSLQETGIGQYVFNGFTSGINNIGNLGINGLNSVNPFMPVAGYEGEQSQGEGGYGNDPMAAMGDLDYPYRSYVVSPVGLIWIPTRKIIQMVNYGVTSQGNPYGYGLRGLYDLWIKKQAAWQFMLRALRSKSAPLVVFFGDPNIPVGDFDANSQALYGNNSEYANTQPGRTIPDAIRDELPYMDSTAAMVLPGLPGTMADVKSIPNEANIDVMMDVLRYIDEAIGSYLFVPRTIFGGGGEGRGSHSLSKTHTDVSQSYAEGMRQDLISTLIHQYVRPQLEEYFTEEEMAANDHYYGSFESDTISIDDQLKLMQMISIASDKGFVSSKELPDLNYVRKMIDFEKMDKAIKVFEQELEKSGMSAKDGDKKKTMTTRDIKDKTGTPYAHGEG